MEVIAKHKWLVRPSQMGSLMSKGRSKDVLFGETAMKVIQEAVVMHKFGIEPEHIETKEMEKGTLNEPQNIELATQVLGWKGVSADQSKRRWANDFMIGEPDVCTDNLLADIKSSWSPKTFHWFPKKTIDKNYYAQLQSYMSLTGHKQAELVYCLSNHPAHILEAEIKRKTHYYVDRPFLFDAESIDDLWTKAEMKATEEVNKVGIIDHVPINNRVQRYVIERDDAYIDQMHERIIEARKIFDELYIKLTNQNK